MRKPVCVAYLRCSTDRQLNSGPAQRDAIRRYHAARLMTSPGSLPEQIVEFEDHAVSGRSQPFFSRVAGTELRRFVQKGDVVIVSKMDRLGRDALDILSTIDWLEKQKVDVHILDCCGMEIGGVSGPIGRLLRIILAGIAEVEGYKISERTKDALAARRNAGKRSGKHPPYGYKFVTGGDGEVRVVPDDDLRNAARYACRLSREGWSYRRIAWQFNADGIEAPKHWPKGEWTPRAVKRVVTNEKRLDCA